jgi:predicted MFS family arabinose efflux permease
LGWARQLVLVPITQQLINGFGWITALNILAASALIMALLAIPLAPYSGRSEETTSENKQTIPQALREALQHRSFLLLVTGFFCLRLPCRLYHSVHAGIPLIDINETIVISEEIKKR